jgi:hypothetical protein
MQILVEANKKVQEFVTQNSTTILTAGGVVGTVATGVFAWRGGYTTAEKILEKEAGAITPPEDDATPLTKFEKVVIATPTTAPAVIFGGATIGCIIMAHRMSAQRAAAIAAAYGLVQKDFAEYKDKVSEKLTGPKNQAIKDEIAQDRVDRTRGAEKIVIIDGTDVLAFDQPTGRYFKSSMEEINSAVNKTNQSIIQHGSVRASEFYDELGLPETTWASNVGFNLDNMVELDITTTQAADGRPCLSINFARFPIEDYERSLY